MLRDKPGQAGMDRDEPGQAGIHRDIQGYTGIHRDASGCANPLLNMPFFSGSIRHTQDLPLCVVLIRCRSSCAD